jgi:hypothetical protein
VVDTKVYEREPASSAEVSYTHSSPDLSRCRAVARNFGNGKDE